MKSVSRGLATLTALLAWSAAVGSAGAQDTTTSPPPPSPPPLAAPSPAPAGGSPTSAPLETPATATPDGTAVPLRRSTIRLPFEAPATAREVVIAQALPAGALYLPGSSTLNGQALPDPLRGPSGRLYWVVPRPADPTGAFQGLVSYVVTHSEALGALPAPALLARLGGQLTELLQGPLDQADLSAARPLAEVTPPGQNAGAIKYPPDGSELRVRELINVVVEGPLGQVPPLSVNGQAMPPEQIGETVSDPANHITRVTYVGVPLRVGPNTLTSGSDTVTVQRIGGTTTVEVTPLALIADGSSPLRLRFRALDAFGKPTAQTSVTLRMNLEPLTPDASPGEADYQLPLTDGEGTLELQPQASPTVLKLAVQQGQEVRTYTFEVTPDQGRVGVGMFSATLGLNGNLDLPTDLTWQARASYEGPLWGGKLYLAADKDGLPTERDTLRRYSIYGDQSTESVPLQGIDPVALRYDHPNFRVEYSRSALPITVLPLGEQFTALSGYSKTNPQVAAFVALVPQDRISEERLTPEGTRLLRLAHGGVAPGSETLEVVTLERLPGTATLTGKEVQRRTLARNVDYQLDYATGVITLARALDPVDVALNPVIVLASYRLDDPLSQRNLTYGVQLGYAAEHLTAGLAAVHLDGKTTFGARATFDDGQVRADGLLAYAGGVQGSLDVNARFQRSTFQASVRYRDPAYDGLAPFSVGLVANALLDTRLNRTFRTVVQAEYQDTPTQSGGSLSGRLEAQLEPFSVGLGAKYAFGTPSGLGVVLSAGYHRAPLDVEVVHTQPLWGDLGGTLDPTTSLTVRYALTERVTLGLTDLINWNTGQTAALTLDTRLGNTNYQLAYDLPNSGGQGNRARFGVTTTLGLAEHLTAGLHGSAVYDLAQQGADFGVGGDLRYNDGRLVATLGSDVVYSTANGFGLVVRGGVTGSLSEHLSLTADGLLEFGQRDGQRFTLGYAYRNRNFNSLGTARYASGSLSAGQPEFTTHLSAESRQYSAVNWAWRAVLDTRTLLNDPESFTVQAGLSAMYYPTLNVGLGVWGHLLSVPAAPHSRLGFGVEGSLRVLPGAWFTLGFNPLGFSGIGRVYTKQGLYIRLDFTVDELVGGK